MAARSIVERHDGQRQELTNGTPAQVYGTGRGPIVNLMPRRTPLYLGSALLVLGAAFLRPNAAEAGFADPAHSYEDPCLVTCPAGDSTFMMVLRNSADVPWLYDEVTIRFCDCPRVKLVPGTFSYQIEPSGCVIGKSLCRRIGWNRSLSDRCRRHLRRFGPRSLRGDPVSAPCRRVVRPGW